MKKIEGNIVDIIARKIYSGCVFIENRIIKDIVKTDKIYNNYIIPGFIDSHVHIESSMLTPDNFSRLVSRHGTVAVVSDPHEIANILGVEGINYMIDNSKKALIKIYTTIPSCVPATTMDASGAEISAEDVEALFKSNNFIGLSEMMNVPGVLVQDKEVLKKINSAVKRNLTVDGHAPLLNGEDLVKYINSGITTDHECSNLNEAKEKINKGMKIIIREGSAAKNYEKLKSLITTNSNDLMFCTDDSHPDNLIEFGEIDKIVKMAVRDGFDVFDVLKIACLNPILHYNLKVGSLKIGDEADFLRIENLSSFKILNTYIAGKKIYQNEESVETNDALISKNENTISITKSEYSNNSKTLLNNFNHELIKEEQLKKSVREKVIAIGLIPGELLTSKKIIQIESSDNLQSDINRDLLKIIYINRYNNSSLPQVEYIVGFGLKNGAIASSVSHDSHNIIAVGCSDKEIEIAVNNVIKNKGGLAIAYNTINNDVITDCLALPIAGIMSDREGEYVASKYKKISNLVLNLGCNIPSPFMTLAFMSLLVIPEIKIGEKGLFDYSKFNFIK